MNSDSSNKIDKAKTHTTTARLRANYRLVSELFSMIMATKKYWLLPFLFVLALLAFFAALTGNQSILPAIYALF